MKALSLITVGVLAAVSLSAETVKFDLNKLRKSSNQTVKENVLTAKTANIIEFGKFQFDPKAKYTLSFDIKNGADTKPATFYAGYYCHDKNGRRIYHENVTFHQNTFTTLTKDVKVGDKTITVKDASKWHRGCSIAFNAKEDLSDLPNYTTFGTITKIEKKDNEWVLTFNKAMNKAYPAGTAVRNHRPGGYVYAIISAPAKDWQTKTKTVQGVNKRAGNNTILNFWPGTATIIPMILVNWDFKRKDTVSQIRNVTLTIEK
jgi:uncharacterized protein YqfB (UPF0267 family)